MDRKLTEYIQVLPPVISRPFLEVSEHLELPPCATYAALNLWNYAARSPDGDLTDPDNLMVTNSFTNTIDEEWFLMVSVAIEARGAKVIPMMLNAVDAVNMNDSVRVTDLLNDLTQALGDLAVLLERMYEKCSPPVFYHEIRPFLAGSKNMAAAGLPDGVFYDRGDGNGEWRQYSGGSNAQSSLIQLFDIVLGVEHRSTGERSSNAGPQTKDRLGFIEVCYYPNIETSYRDLLVSGRKCETTCPVLIDASSPCCPRFQTFGLTLWPTPHTRMSDAHIMKPCLCLACFETSISRSSHDTSSCSPD